MFYGIDTVFLNFDSVLFYYFLFFLAFFFFAVADTRTNDSSCKFFTLIGVLILSVFAGARDLSVGLDTELTVFTFFLPFEKVARLDMVGDVIIREPIYGYLSFALHKLSNGPWVFLFTTQFLTAGPVAAGLYRYRKKALISIGMLIYMLLFYQFSFNIIRQSISAAFLFWAFVECLNRCYFLGVVLSVVCFLFHKSGIIGIFLLFIVFALGKIKKSRTRVIILVAAVLCFLFWFWYWKSLASWAVSVGLLQSRFLVYVAIFSGEVPGHRFLFQGWGLTGVVKIMITSIGLVYTIYALNTKIKKYDYELLTMIYSITLSVLIYVGVFFVLHTIMGWRVSVFGEFIQILFFSRGYTIITDRTLPYRNGFFRIKNSAALHFIIYPFVYNFFVIMIRHPAGTLPYLFF